MSKYITQKLCCNFLFFYFNITFLGKALKVHFWGVDSEGEGKWDGKEYKISME